MRFTSHTVAALIAAGGLSSPYSSFAFAFRPTVTASTAFVVGRSRTTKSALSSSSSTTTTSTTSAAVDDDDDSDDSDSLPSKKEKRLRLMKSDQYHRRGFKDVRENVERSMGEQFQSPIVNDLKSSNYVIERDGVKVYLAKDFGFCWGVERSIALAYEAVEHYPSDKTIHLTNALIHNPAVNEKLQDMNVKFIERVDAADPSDGTVAAKNFDTVGDGDVVILPAFGASLEEMDYLNEKNVEIVDTTCPWVSKVWNTVDKHQSKGLTSIIHGKYAHEETIATASFCEDYICVKNMDEAEAVADYILHGGDKAAFMKRFKKAVSANFDPDTMLKKVGLANQTTMYKKETRAIGQLLQKTMMKKYGPAEVGQHYMEFDTICDATQERQDAVHELVENAAEYKLDFILVVGGWDSSNTAHLLEIPVTAGIRSFHIDRAERIRPDNTIQHRTVSGEIVTEQFLTTDLSSADVIMGVTSGASTPDAAVQDALSSIFMLKKLHGQEQREQVSGSE